MLSTPFLLGVQFVQFPLDRIVFHVAVDVVVVGLVTDDVIVKGCLKQFAASATSCGQRFIRTHHIRDRRAGACSRRFVLNRKQNVYVIWHNGVCIHLYGRISLLKGQQFLFRYFAVVGQFHSGGSKPPPYDTRQNTAPIFRTYRDEIGAVLAVIVFLQSDGFAFGQCAHQNVTSFWRTGNARPYGVNFR